MQLSEVGPRQRWLFILLEALCIPAAILLGQMLKISPLAAMDLSTRDAAAGMLAAAPMLLLAALVIKIPWSFTRSLVRLIERLVVPFFCDWPVVEMAVVAAIAGFGEELLFRGVVQQAAGRALGDVGGLLVASVAFGLVHFLSAAYAAFATVIGLYCGWLWLASDNLLVPMVAHGLYDFLALIYLTRRGTRETVGCPLPAREAE
jgi:hypothetical protein